MTFQKDQAYALKREGNETPDVVYVVFAEFGNTSIRNPQPVLGNHGIVLVCDKYHPTKCRWVQESNLTPYYGDNTPK